jgi:hypothetical protein
MNHHPQVHLTVGDEEADIDEELAPLVREAWLLEIPTMSCCQDAGESLAHLTQDFAHMAVQVAAYTGRSYIDFIDCSDWKAFLDAILAGGPSEGMLERRDHWASDGAWQTHASYHRDIAEVNYHLTFPRSDIVEMTECLCRVREEEASHGH